MKINIETPYNVGDVIYIFSTENVMKYRDLLISEELTFDKFCEHLCNRHTIEVIRNSTYKYKGVIKNKTIMCSYSYFQMSHEEYEIYINGLHYMETPLPISERVRRSYEFEIDESLLYTLDKSILNSNSIIKYLKDKYSSTYSQLKFDIKSTEKIKKHLKKYGFKYTDILDALVSVLINTLAIYDADRMYKRDAIYSWKNYGHLTGPDLHHYNIHIMKSTQNITSSIIPLISLGIIGEITVDEFKDILGIK